MKDSLVPLGKSTNSELGKELNETESSIAPNKKADFKRRVQCLRENKAKFLEWRRTFYEQMTVFSKRNAVERDNRLVNLITDYDCNSPEDFRRVLTVGFGFSTSGVRNQLAEMGDVMELFYEMIQRGAREKAEEQEAKKLKK